MAQSRANTSKPREASSLWLPRSALHPVRGSAELGARFAEAMARAGAPWPAAVGVSGGSDSLALMLLLSDWARGARVAPPVALCVDHGLRSESAREARQVAAWARADGLKAAILKHDAPLPKSDIEAAARNLRYRLMGAYARKHKLAAVYVAHTEDDQAETFLLRLARGSGVDGLAGMRGVAPFPDEECRGILVVRPLLGIGRQALREHLSSLGRTWIEDPMNGDDRFARVRIRKAWPALASVGLHPARIVEAAEHLGRARHALETVSLAVMARACRPCDTGILVDRQALVAAPRELALRALASVLMLVSGNPYRPRFARLTALYGALATDSLGGGRTLHGCRVGPAPRRARVFGSDTLLVQREKSRRAAQKKPPYSQ